MRTKARLTLAQDTHVLTTTIPLESRPAVPSPRRFRQRTPPGVPNSLPNAVSDGFKVVVSCWVLEPLSDRIFYFLFSYLLDDFAIRLRVMQGLLIHSVISYSPYLFSHRRYAVRFPEHPTK